MKKWGVKITIFLVTTAKNVLEHTKIYEKSSWLKNFTMRRKKSLF